VLALLLACSPAPTVRVETPDTGGSVSVTVDDTADSADSGDPVVVDTTTDVIVVGSGPAGVAAAWAAAESGASVILFERDDTPGTGMRLAGMAYGVGTRWQSAMGLEDSLALAESEWEMTTGVAGETPAVAAYIEHSSETLEWLVDQHHFTIGEKLAAATEGTVPRSHIFTWADGAEPYSVVMAEWPGELRTEVEVTEPLMRDGAVVGVRWRDQVTGEEGATGAAAVVLASGGFLRDLEAVAPLRPDLVDHDPVFETNPNSVGSTLPFLDVAGAGRYNLDNVGAYLHSLEDPSRPGEALILTGLGRYILVGADGHRFTLDVNLGSFTPANEAPEGDLWLVAAGDSIEHAAAAPPGYNWAVESEPERYTLHDVIDMGSADVVYASSLEDLQNQSGIAADLLDEVTTFNANAELSLTDEFGRVLGPGDVIEGPEWLAARLRPGLAKNFGGVWTDMQAHVLDEYGQVIPGLYAAGEVAGMIPGGGSGTGFSGSSSACYYGGRLAGANAAADAVAL